MKKRLQKIIQAIQKHTQIKQSGMSLIEIMVVLVIIGIVSTIVGVQVLKKLEEAKISTTRTQIKNIGDALDLYKISKHRYPSTSEGLQALKASGDLKEIPKDPWDHDYVYLSPGTRSQDGYDLMSYGPDGAEGGGDDISNFSENK